MLIKSAISFALVHIPISLHTATVDNDVRFNQLHKEDHKRIRYKKVCSHCGKEVTAQDIVKGFAYDKGKYVVVNDEDFEAIKTEKDRSMHILQFTDLNQISPLYYEKTYHAIPEKGAEKAFELLRIAMLEEEKIAIAKTVLGAKETLLALIPREEGLLVETMFFADEIKELPRSYVKPALHEAELKMAITLIQSMNQAFVPEQYEDEYQNRLKDLIGQKIAGQEIPSSNKDTEDNVIDLMDALKASIEQSKTTKPKAPGKKKAQA